MEPERHRAHSGCTQSPLSPRRSRPTLRSPRTLREATLGVLGGCLLLLAACSREPARTAASAESWFAVKINDGKAGWAKDIRSSGRTETASEITIKRGDSPTRLFEETVWEEADGRPLRYTYRSQLSASESVQTGEIKGERLEVCVRAGAVEEKKVHAWAPHYLFPSRIELLHREKGRAPGTAYTYMAWNPQFGKAVTHSVKVAAHDRRETSIDAMPGVVTTEWLDAEGRVVRSHTELMGMKIVHERCDRAAALMTDKGDVPEVLVRSLLRPSRKLADPRKVRKATYRLTIKEGEVREQALRHDGQTVDKVEGRSITLTVDPVAAEDPKLTWPIDDGRYAAFLSETTILQCRDAKVIAAAKEAVGAETDAWKAARQIETWVRQKISKKSFGVGFASAREVLDALEGDCTEHSVLSAAMARALGIPSRVAVGLVSVGDIFGGHMWTEVWVGKWVPLDATLPGEFDATHIKMGDSAAGGANLQEDLLNVLFFIGKMELEILEAVER